MDTKYQVLATKVNNAVKPVSYTHLVVAIVGHGLAQGAGLVLGCSGDFPGALLCSLHAVSYTHLMLLSVRVRRTVPLAVRSGAKLSGSPLKP